MLGATGSYYFARSRGRAGRRWYAMVAAGMMVPFQIGVLPLYKVFTDLGLSGNRLSVIIFRTAAAAGDGHRHHPRRRVHLERVLHPTAVSGRHSQRHRSGTDLRFRGGVQQRLGQIFAGLLIASIPLLVVFFVFQRYMIRSFGNGLKG